MLVRYEVPIRRDGVSPSPGDCCAYPLYAARESQQGSYRLIRQCRIQRAHLAERVQSAENHTHKKTGDLFPGRIAGELSVAIRADVYHVKH